MRLRLITLAHVLFLGIESMVLVGLFSWAILLAVRPIGLTSTGEGDTLRFRFAQGQDALIARCGCVLVTFITKEFPRAFENPNLTIRKALDAKNPYGWIEIPAPAGAYAFRFDVHRIKGTDVFEHGPDVAEMYLGHVKLSWTEIKTQYQFDKTWHVPCYLFRPEHFLNLSVNQVVCMAIAYLIAFFVLSGAILWLKGRGLFP